MVLRGGRFGVKQSERVFINPFALLPQKEAKMVSSRRTGSSVSAESAVTGLPSLENCES